MSESASRQPRENGANDESLVDTVRGWLRGLRRSPKGDTVRDALEELIEERDEGEEPIDDHERLLLHNILNLGDCTAEDVMIPRADIIAVDGKVTFQELCRTYSREGHSRLPVYRGHLDDVIGMVHIKDVLALVGADKPFSLSPILRKILFVPPSIRVLDLLLEMRRKRTHMALVVDEYGGIDGLVTIEDLVEQIIGKIKDEHDSDEEADLVVRADGVIEADARTPIEDFEQQVGPLLSEDEREDVDTLGGLVFAIAGRIPSRGELIHHPAGLEFEVVDADPRRIKRLRVWRRTQPPPVSEHAS